MTALINYSQPRKIKGALHVHSVYSDGEFTLPELRDIFLASGCEFVCMTDHAEAFTTEKLANYVSECGRLSDSRFRFIPGLEFQCENKMHILGYGVASLLDTTKPQEVIARIDDLGGVSVIAHPSESAFLSIMDFHVLPKGIETWNTKYDGRYAPRIKTFRLLHLLQERRPDMLAFFGLDLHWRQQYRGLLNVLYCQNPEPAQILSALKDGKYSALKGELEMSSSGALDDEVLKRFEKLHRHSDRLRDCKKKAATVSLFLRLPVPSAVKRQLRKLF